jgi:D-serine deaminase-like pyridoxal phosphate-dependent protein
LIGCPLEDLPTPALLIDADLLERNLAAMKQRMGGGKTAYYHVIRNGVVEAVWPVAARGRSD